MLIMQILDIPLEARTSSWTNTHIIILPIYANWSDSGLAPSNYQAGAHIPLQIWRVTLGPCALYM